MIHKIFSLGTPALTTRGLVEKDIDQVVEYIDRAIAVAKKASDISGPKLVDFKKVLVENADIVKAVADLRHEVEEYSKKFPMPGYQEY